ncbi:hypothetical protein ABK040_012492 [Willaertia magna]
MFSLKLVPEGPWSEDLKNFPGSKNDLENNPEKYTFHYSGFKCWAKRAVYFHWCGYIQLPETHPDFGKSYDELGDINVHEELTYSDGNGVFGYDCAHYYDIVPVWTDIYGGAPSGATYKDIEFVKNQLKEMAKQFLERSEKSIADEGDG